MCRTPSPFETQSGAKGSLRIARTRERVVCIDGARIIFGAVSAVSRNDDDAQGPLSDAASCAQSHLPSLHKAFT
jgi:hypothetical protein